MSKRKNTDYQLYAEASEDAEASALRKSIAATKFLKDYEDEILTELLFVFVDYKKDLTKESIESIKNQLGDINVNDLAIIPNNIFPLLKDIMVVGQNIIKTFNSKNPGFFEVEHNQSVTKYNSTTSFVLDVLKKGLITNFEKVGKEFNEYHVAKTPKLQDQKSEKKDQTSSFNEPREEPSKRRVSDAFPDTGGDSALRESEQEMEFEKFWAKVETEKLSSEGVKLVMQKAFGCYLAEKKPRGSVASPQSGSLLLSTQTRSLV